MNELPTQPDNKLDRAITALRDADIPPGPPPHLATSTAEAAERESQVIPFKERTLSMLWKIRYPSAAAVLLLAIFVGWLLTGSTNIALADVAERVRNAQTMKCKISQKQPGQPSEIIEVMMKGSRYRTINHSNNLIQIADGDKGKLLDIDLNAKRAFIHSYQKQGDNPLDLITRFIDDLHANKIEDLGVRNIAEMKAVGFRSQDGTGKGESLVIFEVWIGAKTELPIKIETLYSSGSQKLATISEFVWDAELEDSLFDLTPPEGYEVTYAADEMTEQDLVEALRIWTIYSGGSFPDKIDRQFVNEFLAMIADKQELKQDTSPLAKITRGAIFVNHPMRSPLEWHYTGAGVKLGEADKIVAYWKATQDAPAYRVLNGDLSIKDIKPEDLPESLPKKE